MEIGDIQHELVGETNVLSTEHGYLDYDWDEKNKRWNITDIKSKKKGEGKRLVKAFVDKVGLGQRVLGQAIIEPETRKALNDAGLLYDVVVERKPIEISDRELLKKLKIIKVFEGGGVKVEKLVIIPQEDGQIDNYFVNISVLGTT